jgi:hypothetical protein
MDEEVRLSAILSPIAGTVKIQRIYKPAGVALRAEFPVVGSQVGDEREAWRGRRDVIRPVSFYQ